jgi:hypothetical protein
MKWFTKSTISYLEARFRKKDQSAAWIYLFNPRFKEVYKMNKSLVEFHLLIRKAANRVYPVAIAFDSSFLTPFRVLVKGEGELLAAA